MSLLGAWASRCGGIFGGSLWWTVGSNLLLAVAGWLMWHTNERRVLKMTDSWPAGGRVWQLPACGFVFCASAGFFVEPVSAFLAVPASIAIAALAALRSARGNFERFALGLIVIANAAEIALAAPYSGWMQPSDLVPIPLPEITAGVAAVATVLGVTLNRRTVWNSAAVGERRA